MYRGRKRPRKGENDSNEVRGPNSALTQFLKEQGINAESIRQRWLKGQKKDDQDGADEKEEEKEKENVSENEVKLDLTLDSDDDEDENSDVNNRARSLKYSDDSDEEEYDNANRSSTLSETPVPIVDESEVSKAKKSKLRLQQLKRKKRRAADLLDRRVRRVSTLQDTCITNISANILKLQKENESAETITSSHIRDVLGGISIENLNKLARTLSKNRALNDNTLQLFLKTQLQSLTFHDCSKISYEGYKQLAIFTPNLTKLSLQMCGQLNNEALLYIADKLPMLREIYLDGPFLINEPTWDLFFNKMEGRLAAFHVSNTHRFTDDCLSSLLKNCGSTLVSLKLARLDMVTNYALLSQYLINPDFEALSLEHPVKEEDITDELVVNILSQIGPRLKHLSLNGCTGLTDTMIINGMATFLHASDGSSVLQSMELEELDQITTDGLVYFLSSVQLPHLMYCNLRRCLQLGDMAIIELCLNKAGASLETLNLNSMKGLSRESFASIACPKLKQLNVGFVRSVDDKIVEKLGEQNPKLEILEVYGDNLITHKANIRQGLTVIGRQSDTI